MTTLLEDFNTADSATVGHLLTWTDLVGDIQNVSNHANVPGTAATTGRSRAESDLATTNQYAQIVVNVITPSANTSFHGAAVRYASGSDDCYVLYNVRDNAGVDTLRLAKCVTGTLTTLASAGITLANADVLRIEVTGSSLTGYQNGISRVTVIDTAITTGLRGGIMLRAGSSASRTNTWIDSFEAGDLSAAGPVAKSLLMYSTPARMASVY